LRLCYEIIVRRQAFGLGDQLGVRLSQLSPRQYHCGQHLGALVRLKLAG
jgi:hypothetical protein